MADNNLVNVFTIYDKSYSKKKMAFAIILGPNNIFPWPEVKEMLILLYQANWPVN